MKSGGASALNGIAAYAEDAVVWVCLMLGPAAIAATPASDTTGACILVICFITVCRALWTRRRLPSGDLRHEALGAVLVSLSLALAAFLVFMDGLGINPALNVNFGQGILGIAIPLLVVIAILAWTVVSAIAAQEAPKGHLEWLVLFFVSVVLGGFALNPLTGNGGAGIALGVTFGSFCLYRSARDLARLGEGRTPERGKMSAPTAA